MASITGEGNACRVATGIGFPGRNRPDSSEGRNLAGGGSVAVATGTEVDDVRPSPSLRPPCSGKNQPRKRQKTARDQRRDVIGYCLDNIEGKSARRCAEEQGISYEKVLRWANEALAQHPSMRKLHLPAKEKGKIDSLKLLKGLTSGVTPNEVKDNIKDYYRDAYRVLETGQTALKVEQKRPEARPTIPEARKGAVTFCLGDNKRTTVKACAKKLGMEQYGTLSRWIQEECNRYMSTIHFQLDPEQRSRVDWRKLLESFISGEFDRDNIDKYYKDLVPDSVARANRKKGSSGSRDPSEGGSFPAGGKTGGGEKQGDDTEQGRSVDGVDYSRNTFSFSQEVQNYLHRNASACRVIGRTGEREKQGDDTEQGEGVDEVDSLSIFLREVQGHLYTVVNHPDLPPGQYLHMVVDKPDSPDSSEGGSPDPYLYTPKAPERELSDPDLCMIADQSDPPGSSEEGAPGPYLYMPNVPEWELPDPDSA
ncbi:MAG: hypothetical protein OXF02_03355 [Simkaniaceae bacterium]|nr:hypothetical protein [Simkaniaceae bacterium]